MELFRETFRSISPPDPEDQYETYLRESVVQKYSVTVMLRSNLDNIEDDDFVPILFARNRYLKGSLWIVKVKFFTA